MSEFRASYRYALALLGVAGETEKLDEVGDDVARIERLLAGSRDFVVFLRSPVVNPEKKRRVLAEVLQGKVGALTMKFVLLLASKGREGLLPGIIVEFKKLRDERLGILNVKARTAVALSPEQERALAARIEEVTKKKVHISYVLDPALVGGFTVQLEDTVWDASIRHQLEALRKRFAEGSR